MPDLTAFVTFVGALLAIMNPLSTAPMFLTWTAGQTVAEQRRTAFVTSLAVLVTLVVSGIGGEYLLHFFGVRVPSFSVAGGLITLAIGFSMLRARRDRMTNTRGEGREAEAKEDVAIFPLAVPLLGGPASITIVIVHSQQLHGIAGFVILVAGIAGITALLWVSLRSAVAISSRLSHTATNVVTRLMGILLTAIAIEMIAGGLGKLFPVLLTTPQ